MSTRAFVDTNVFVYAMDHSEPAKRERALAVLDAPGENLVISPQVLGEFYTVVTRRLQQPLDPEIAAAATDQLSTLPSVPLDDGMVLAAIATSRRFQIAYWDALIVEAASRGRCERVLTEDLAHGMLIGSVRIENPFADLPA